VRNDRVNRCFDDMVVNNDRWNSLARGEQESSFDQRHQCGGVDGVDGVGKHGKPQRFLGSVVSEDGVGRIGRQQRIEIGMSINGAGDARGYYQ
jgi:hypothetical protein